MIERYIYDVTRRLPEAEREEVGRELRANILDMLPENPGEEEIREVLISLGPPAALAEKYRQKPRYLISPALYDSYITALKHIVPLVGVIVLIVGLILGGVESMRDGVSGAAGLIASVLTKGLSMGGEAVIQALLWTTVGFVIAEKAGAKIGEDWKPESLPEVPKHGKYKIPLSDSIAELVVMLVFSAIAVFMFLRGFPFFHVAKDSGVNVVQLFSPEFLRALVPLVIVMCAFGVLKGVVKIKERRWTPLVCTACVLDELVSIGAALYILFIPRVFDPEFLTWVSSQDTGDFDLMRLFGTGVGVNLIVMIFAAIVIIAGIATICSAIYKTVRSMNS